MTETAAAGSRVPADGTYPTTCWECSTCCGALATVRDGPGRRLRAQPRPPLLQGRLLHQRHPRRAGHHLSAQPPALPHAPHRRARRGQVGAHLLGRGARRDGRPAGQGAPEVWTGGDRRRHQRRLLQPQRDPGADAALDRLAQLDDQPGPVRRLPRGERARHGPRHHARRGHRQHALRADRRPQPQHRRPGRMGGAQGRQEARRAHHRHRPQAHAGGADGRPVARPEDRHGCRAGAGHDPCADRRGASTTRRSSRAGATASTQLAERAAQYPPAVAAGASPACRPSRSSPRRACTPTGPRPSSAATASTPSAPACRRSAPTTASSPSAATSTAPAATCACARRAACKQLHRPAAHAGVPARCRDRAAHHRRRPLPAVGRAQGLADGLPQPLRHRGHADGPALSRARALCQRRQHPRHLSRHAAHDGGAALARLRGGGRARHDADRRASPTSCCPRPPRSRRRRCPSCPPARPCSSRAPSCRRRARRAARSTSPCRCSTRWRERQAVTRHLLPWRSQREFNTYLLGDCGIRIEDLERTGYHQVSAEPVAGRARSPRRPARSSCSPPTMEGLGLDPLPAYDSAEPRAPAPRSTARRYPLILVTGDREKSYHHSRFRDQAWAMQGVARPAAHHAPRHGARPGARRRRLGPARGGARQGRLPPAPQAHRSDAAGRRQHRHGLVAAVRRPRPSTARSTSTSMPRSPTTAPRTRSPAPPTCAACLAGWKRSGLERHPTAACGAAVSPRSSFHRCTSRKPCSRAARSNGFCSTTKPSRTASWALLL